MPLLSPTVPLVACESICPTAPAPVTGKVMATNLSLVVLVLTFATVGGALVFKLSLEGPL